ncbi:hypothetical protein BPNPMPFG_003298 [Mesorhizobium sp. AR07]|uniref:hypothetical protein n=1 Tax=Mesorhizobium sp. AR07 TaxID=2865838 RepID=UPI00215F619A|nr:hypothetical protein [Mesorhizobium sp. AR07]UVK47515.1 hypothetical protein BPNPMPFG_003298 [Mesorhizobium sp. AR07]
MPVTIIAKRATEIQDSIAARQILPPAASTSAGSQAIRHRPSFEERLQNCNLKKNVALNYEISKTGRSMSRESKPKELHIPSDLFGVYATLIRGSCDGDFRSNFITSYLYIDCMAAHLKAARKASGSPLSSFPEDARKPL